MLGLTREEGKKEEMKRRRRRESDEERSESERGTFVLSVSGGTQAGGLELPSSLLQDTMKL